MKNISFTEDYKIPGAKNKPKKARPTKIAGLALRQRFAGWEAGNHHLLGRPSS
jgi:hypothetical protein